MSIIYEALKKTQQRSEGYKPLKTSFSWMDILLVLTIGCLLSLVVVAYAPKIQAFFSSKASASVPKPPIAKPITNAGPAISKVINKELEYQGALVLNGVFISDQEKVALMNNQPFHIGDVVEGKKIISIQPGAVRLKDTSQVFILRSAT